MPITIELGDMKITVTTLDEMVSVVNALRGAGGRSGKAGGGKGADPMVSIPLSNSGVIPPPAAGESKPLRMLRAIHAAGSGGVLNSVIAKGLGLANPKGLGPILVGLRHELARASMHQNDAMSVTKTPEGTRYSPTERTAEAIQKLSKPGAA